MVALLLGRGRVAKALAERVGDVDECVDLGRSVELSGATGPRAEAINGVYEPTLELSQGQVVFVKKASASKSSSSISSSSSLSATPSFSSSPSLGVGDLEGWVGSGARFSGVSSPSASSLSSPPSPAVVPEMVLYCSGQGGWEVCPASERGRAGGHQHAMAGAGAGMASASGWAHVACEAGARPEQCTGA